MSELEAKTAVVMDNENELTPRQIVAELDCFVIAQDEAKKVSKKP